MREARGLPHRALSGLAELVPTLPDPVRAVLRNAVWTYGRATSFARPLPDFLILGAQKAGTTALYSYLRRHPSITGPSWKEVSYFDRHYARGAAWYRGNFPNKAAHARQARRRGEPELPLPPARVRSACGSWFPEARLDRARAQPGRPRAVALQPRGRARPRAAVVRGRARRRGRAAARRGGAARRRPALLQPRVVEPHLQGARPLRGAARALARGLPAASSC